MYLPTHPTSHIAGRRAAYTYWMGSMYLPTPYIRGERSWAAHYPVGGILRPWSLSTERVSSVLGGLLGPQLRLITPAHCTTTTLSSLADPPVALGCNSADAHWPGALQELTRPSLSGQLSHPCQAAGRGPRACQAPLQVHQASTPSVHPPKHLRPLSQRPGHFPRHPSIISKSPSIPPVAVPGFCP